MPVQTRKQRKLLEGSDDISRAEALVELTNTRRVRQTRKKQEIARAQESSSTMKLTQQNTVEIPTEVRNANGRKRKAAKTEASVADQLEDAVDPAKKSRIKDPVKLPKEASVSVAEEVVPVRATERKRKAVENEKPASQNDEIKRSKKAESSQEETSGSTSKESSSVSDNGQKREVIENTASQNAESSQSTTEELSAIVVLKMVKKMHENNFMNVAERLELDPVPCCLYNLKKCHEEHKVKNVIKSIPYTTKLGLMDALSIDSRICRFVHGMRHNILALKLFPGSDLLAKILDQILKLSSSHEDYNINFALTELHSLFTDVIEQFPPCHIRAHYLEVFKTQFSIEGIQERNQLLPTILEQLSELIFTRHTQAEKTKVYNDDIAYNFEVWDQYHQDETFANFSANDKFERLFLVLDLAVRILEHDTSIFMMKHSHDFASSIFNEKLKPLICSVIWQDEESVIVINSTIKQLISIFVAMVALRYPADKIKIVSRLLTLVSHVINMYEYPHDTFQYPIYKNYSIDLAREIQKCIEKSNYFSVHLHQRVVESIRSPLVRMLLMNFMITKVTGEIWPDSLSHPINSISSGEMEKFDDKPRKELEWSDERYPKFDDKKKIKKCTVVQSDYIQMLLNFTEAVDSYFGISQACLTVNAPESSTTQQSQLGQDLGADDYEKLLSSEIVALRKVDLKFKKMVHIRFTMETSQFFVEEMNNFRDLVKSIKIWHLKYGSKFDGWMNYVQQIKAKKPAM